MEFCRGLENCRAKTISLLRLRKSWKCKKWRMTWETVDTLVPLYKNKGEVHQCTNYEGIKLQSQNESSREFIERICCYSCVEFYKSDQSRNYFKLPSEEYKDICIHLILGKSFFEWFRWIRILLFELQTFSCEY